MNLKLSESLIFKNDLNSLPDKKLLINTINAHSFNIAQKDKKFADALYSSDILLPDGISVVLAMRFLFGIKVKKIAGADLFNYEMQKLNDKNGKCFFLGSSSKTLDLIEKKVHKFYPKVDMASYSPPYVNEFSISDNLKMLSAINSFRPDVLFIGMTAPKQEKWAHTNFSEIDAGHICSIGAVFDFFAGTVKRAPSWMIKIGFEWLYRFFKEPLRLWKRYILGNFKFILFILKEKFNREKSDSIR